MTRLEALVGAALRRQWEQKQQLLKLHGDDPLGVITFGAAADGMRDLLAVLCQTSRVEPKDGVRYREIPIADLIGLTMEEAFLLLLLGERPGPSDVELLAAEVDARIPKLDRGTIRTVLEANPEGTHPMDLLGLALMVMNRSSRFREAAGTTAKEDLWKLRFEDAIRMMAWLPEVLAMVHAVSKTRSADIPTSGSRLYTDRFADMLGLPGDPATVRDAIRKYMLLHVDHEGGNVSAFTAYVVGSARSTPFEMVGAAMNGLSGPLHGLASQDALAFVQEIIDAHGGVPSRDQIAAYIGAVRARKGTVWGYGHRVLRDMDPRARLLLAIGQALFPDSPPFKTAGLMAEVIPPILLAEGKVTNPNPNIDAISGSFLYGLGMRDPRYNTVMFGGGRTIGLLGQDVVNYALGHPIVRPTSFTLAEVPGLVAKGKDVVLKLAEKLRPVPEPVEA